MCANRTMRLQHGFSLIELVITIVIVSIAITAIGLFVATAVRGSADPVLQNQAIYLAESFLEEAILKAYSDPDGINEGCGVSRDRWDDVADYACLSTLAAPTRVDGTAISALADYRVSMSVAAPVVQSGATVRRISVRVTHIKSSIDISLSALRAENPP